MRIIHANTSNKIESWADRLQADSFGGSTRLHPETDLEREAFACFCFTLKDLGLGSNLTQAQKASCGNLTFNKILTPAIGIWDNTGIEIALRVVAIEALWALTGLKPIVTYMATEFISYRTGPFLPRFLTIGTPRPGLTTEEAMPFARAAIIGIEVVTVMMSVLSRKLMPCEEFTDHSQSHQNQVGQGCEVQGNCEVIGSITDTGTED